jgi:hypothetical protein
MPFIILRKEQVGLKPCYNRQIATMKPKSWRAGFNCIAFRSPPLPRSSRVSIINACAGKIRQDDNVWQELYQDITKLAEKQNVLPSKPRTAGRDGHALRTNH